MKRHLGTLKTILTVLMILKVLYYGNRGHFPFLHFHYSENRDRFPFLHFHYSENRDHFPFLVPGSLSVRGHFLVHPIFNILDNTKYIIGEIFSSGGATLYMNPSDQNVYCLLNWQ